MKFEFSNLLSDPSVLSEMNTLERDNYFSILRGNIVLIRSKPVVDINRFITQCCALAQSVQDYSISSFFSEIAAYTNSGLEGKEECDKNISRILTLPNIGPFTSGVLRFSRGDYRGAADDFDEFHNFTKKTDLKFHQTAAMSVRHSEFESAQHQKPRIFLKSRARNNIGPVFLVSCDVGYLVAYGNEFLAKVKKVSATAHFHIINPIESVIQEFLNKNSDELGLSYETVCIGDLRTYTSIARFVVAEQMLDLYGEVVICDIDLDVRTHPSVISKIAEGKPALVFGVSSYFAWTRVLAGHAYFIDTLECRGFLIKLRLYMQSHYFSGRDGWMLDQTALEFCVRTSALQFVNINGLPNYPLVQVGDRAAKRAIARRVVESISNHSDSTATSS